MKQQNDLLLINPGIYSSTRSYGQMLHEPTMGLYVLRDYLTNRGFKIEILDGAYKKLDKAEILKRIQVSAVVGFYAVYTNMKTIFELSSLIKDKNPNSIILIGGPNWPAGREILLAESNIDIVIKGEGESSLEKILLRLKDGGGVTPEITNGTFLRFSGQIINAGKDSSLQVSSKNSKPISIQFNVPNMKKSILKLITAKGCPNRCHFCPSPKWQELASIEKLVQVMEAAWHKGIDTFYIADENFCPPKLSHRTILFCNLVKNCDLKKARLYLKLFLEPHMPLDALNQLSQIAHITAFVGFESFSDNTLKFLGKNTTRQNNLLFWNTARKFGINILPGIITLHPFLSPEELLDLINVLSMHNALSWRLLLKKLDLYPGTHLLTKMKSKFPDLIKNEFSSFIHPSYWSYAYDKNLGRPIMANIEKAFMFIAEQNEVKELYSLMFDLSFVVEKKEGKIVDRYYSIRSDFVRYTRKLALKIVKIITQNPDVNFKKQLDPSISQYLNVIDIILKNCRKLFWSYDSKRDQV